MKRYAFIIPAYNPTPKLVETVETILKSGDEMVFVVDDGTTRPEGKAAIEEVQKLADRFERVVLLKHAVNMGKGAALKSAFNDILVHWPDITGAVTMDADGQHLLKDAYAVLACLRENPDAYVLGYREFGKDIPLRSYVGNQISKWVYKLILGYPFKDTQTGLRGLGRNFMKRSLTIASNRFEFETEQLILAVRLGVAIKQIPIETIYIDHNKTSSFRPLIDSFKIYFVLLRYGAASVATALADYLVFTLMIFLGESILVANLVARTVSIGVQYTLLDRFVFYTRPSFHGFLAFAAYVYVMGIISSMAQIGLVEAAHWPVLVAKIFVEGVLFFVNFAFLRLFLFKRDE